MKRLLTMLLLLILLTGCGGSDVENVYKANDSLFVVDESKDTLIINRSDESSSYAEINTIVSSGSKASILNATYSQLYRDQIGANYWQFVLSMSVILGQDKSCIDCLTLSPILNSILNNGDITLFIIIEDQLTLGFVEGILSTSGMSAVLVSSNEDLLINSEYNYQLALIGETSNPNIDWHITDNKDCSAKCISPTNAGLGEFDAVID